MTPGIWWLLGHSLPLVNNGTTAAQMHINFFDDNGNPLPLPLIFLRRRHFRQRRRQLVGTLNPGAADR
jgi:hypothetical protein